MSFALIFSFLTAFVSFSSSSISSSFQSKSGQYPTLFLVNNVCWSSSDPTTLTVHHNKQNDQGTLPPNLIFTSFKFQESSVLWKKISRKANIFIEKPVSFVFTYQCAFQHVTREFLPHLAFLYQTLPNMESLIARVLTFQSQPYSQTPDWTNSLLSSLTKDLPNPPKFSNLASCPLTNEAFSSKSSCRPFLPYYEPQHECRHDSNWTFCAKTVAFSNHLWYFDLQSSHSIRKAVLGNEIYHPPRAICLNQRVGTRSILNLMEVHHFLVSQFPNHIVRTYSYEGKSFLEQARIVNKCKLILHPHSGGETNLMFLHPNSTVIEFFSKYFDPVTYFGELVEGTGSTHIPMIVEDVELPAGCERYRGNQSSCGNYQVEMTPCTSCYKDANFIVDLKALKILLQNLLLT
jgi:hypothetical protein